jgi:hypothetical protein
MDPKPGGKETTVVKGADGVFYIADKKNGKLTPLSPADTQKINDFIEKAEEDLTNLLQGHPPFIGGGVNLCVPEVFP